MFLTANVRIVVLIYSMMELIFYIAPLVFLIWYFCLSSSYRRKLNLAKTFPGPRCIPLLGNVLQFIFRNPEDAFKLTIDYHKLLGGIYVLRAFNIFAFMVKDPKIMEQVLSNSTKYLDKSRLYLLLHEWLGDGLLLSKGKKWSSRRKIITPAFHFSILKQFVEVFDRQSSILVEILCEHSNGQILNIQPFITRMTLDVVCETSMGVRINAQTDRDHQYVKSVGTITKIISERLTKIWMRNNFFFRYFANTQYKVYKKALNQLHDFTISIIRQRRKAMQNEKKQITPTKQSIEATDLGIRDKMALLDILLQSTTIDGEPLNDESIREEVDTFMFEGHDTTTAAIVFTLHLISRHKPVQDRLFDEIVNVIGSNRTTPATFQHLSSLKYMEAVIKESLRMYAPVPFIGRYLDNDIVLDDGRVIPKDTHFNLMLFVMFRDPQYFSNPDEFNPDRFIAIDETTNPYVFIPFSAGSRNCIGQKFALLEIKSTISKILRHYELIGVGDPPEVIMELLLRSKNGIQLGHKCRPKDHIIETH